MSKRYTETELEKIVRIGCDRIDQAVERVCAKYEVPQRYSNRWLHEIVLEELFYPVTTGSVWPDRFARLLYKDELVGLERMLGMGCLPKGKRHATGLEQVFNIDRELRRGVVVGDEEKARMHRAMEAIQIGPRFLVSADKG